jgi:SAM-dependent methyltransferase
MHDTAFALGRTAIQTYLGATGGVLLEIGSADVNGTLRDQAPPGTHYIGADVEVGPGVDIVVAPSKPLPIADETVDLAISTSVFEHDPFFWETFLDLLRVLRPGGYIYVNAPSNGAFHRHPTDQWRFYPDAGKCLVAWARSKGVAVTLVESFIADRLGDQWNDFVAVFAKGEVEAAALPRPLHEQFRCRNIWRLGADALEGHVDFSEDVELLGKARAELAESKEEIDDLRLLIAELRLELDGYRLRTETAQETLSADNQRLRRLVDGQREHMAQLVRKLGDAFLASREIHDWLDDPAGGGPAGQAPAPPARASPTPRVPSAKVRAAAE